jgi:hypothetical protein
MSPTSKIQGNKKKLPELTESFLFVAGTRLPAGLERASATGGYEPNELIPWNKKSFLN